jgi:short-subunit dehydrogenase
MPTALITGASSGIGKAFAQELAARKINLVLVARSEEKLSQLAKQLKEQHNIEVDVIVKDLTEDNAAATIYGDIRASLEKQGRPIHSLDTLIAAHALSLQVTLITNNIREFSRVPNLKSENWVS